MKHWKIVFKWNIYRRFSTKYSSHRTRFFCWKDMAFDCTNFVKNVGKLIYCWEREEKIWIFSFNSTICSIEILVFTVIEIEIVRANGWNSWNSHERIRNSIQWIDEFRWIFAEFSDYSTFNSTFFDFTGKSIHSRCSNSTQIRLFTSEILSSRNLFSFNHFTSGKFLFLLFIYVFFKSSFDNRNVQMHYYVHGKSV